MPKPQRQYVVRTPANRNTPLTAKHCAGEPFPNKRVAIKHAQILASQWRRITPVRDRRISVYTVDAGKRPSLLWQGHFSRRQNRVVSEVL